MKLQTYAACLGTIAMMSAVTADAVAQATRPNISIGPRGPSITTIGPRGPNFDGPRRPHRDGPRHPSVGGGVIILTPPGGGGGPPPQQIVQPPSDNNPPPRRRVTRRSNAPAANETRLVPDEVILEFSGNLSQQQVERIAASFGLTRIESQRFVLLNATMFRWRIPDPNRRSVANVIRALEGDSRIRNAFPNYKYTVVQGGVSPASADAAAGDPAQYTVGKLQLPLAHNIARGDKVLVAVIDSAIDTRHPELNGVVADSFDGFKANEPHTHGTAIAGAIAARSRLMGVAPAAQVLGVAAFGESQGSAEGTTFNILKGLDWAASKGARVINMSFAGPKDAAMGRALSAARQKGVVLIAAAGNAGAKSPPLYPAADPNVIAVTATDANDNLFDGSNRGNHVAIAAPGVDILLPSPGASYQVTSGTSFAAAHISGVVALMLERRPELTPDAVRKLLAATARDLGPKGKDAQFGAGLADAYQAVKALEEKPIAGKAGEAKASAAR